MHGQLEHRKRKRNESHRHHRRPRRLPAIQARNQAHHAVLLALVVCSTEEVVKIRLDVGFFLDTTENYLLHTASIRPHGRRRSRPAHAGIFSLPRTTIRGARPCNDGSKARPRGRAAARAADLDAFNYRYLRIALATTRYLSTSPCSSTAQYDAYAPAARQHHMHPPRSVRGPASSSCWLCSVQRSKPLYDSAAQRVRCPTHALRDGAQHSMTHGLGER